MGYTKIVQYGDVTELYSYSKNLVNYPKKYVSQMQKKRRLEISKLSGNSRTKYSINRARKSFFRLCHANNINAKSIAFVTLTFADDVSYPFALRCVSRFFANLKKYESISYSQVSYIGVPELTKAGRYHFHLLVYNLLPSIAESERDTRNLQRCCWQRGYLTIRFAHDSSPRIAGYMAKYMGKFLADSKTEARRAYTCSRNIEKVRSYGSNSFDEQIFNSMIRPDGLAENVSSYDVPYLGTCNYSKYQL